MYILFRLRPDTLLSHPAGQTKEKWYTIQKYDLLGICQDATVTRAVLNNLIEKLSIHSIDEKFTCPS